MNHLKNKSFYPWLIWGLAAGFFLAEYFARVSTSVMVHPLMKALEANAYQIGSLSAMFYYAYVLMQVPVGLLVDRLNIRYILSISSAICAFTCIGFSFADSVTSAQVYRFFMGFSASFAFVGTLKIATVWFKASRFGLLAGTTQALGMLGAALGEGPVSSMVVSIGWQLTMQIIGYILLVIAILMYLMIRSPDKKTFVVESIKTEYTLFKSAKIIASNPQTWFNALAIGCLYAPTAAFAELWGPSYIHANNDVSHTVAASAVGLIFIGWAIGGPICGWLSDTIKKRKPLLLLSCLFSLLWLSLAIYLPHLSITALSILLFLYGLSNVGVAISYTIAAEIHPKEIAGTSIALTNMASVIIGAILQPVIGMILVNNWDQTMIDGIPVYTASNYHEALMLLPICFVIATLAALCVKESYPKQ